MMVLLLSARLVYFINKEIHPLCAQSLVGFSIVLPDGLFLYSLILFEMFSCLDVYLPSRLAQQRLQLNNQEMIVFFWQRLVRGRSYRHLMKEVGYK
jgi:hypothetical protein